VSKEKTRMANGRSRVIEETTELGIGILIAESQAGAYKPVALVSTIREARDMAMHRRTAFASCLGFVPPAHCR
jgi:hypothetical protein